MSNVTTEEPRAPHCWADYAASLEVGSDAWVRYWSGEDGGATCILEDGHDGPHEWTPDGEISVEFAA
jgi:hypothetical protein